MYCTKCGADNSETATYCRKCGVLLEQAEEETRVASRVTPSPAYVPPTSDADRVRARVGGDADTDANEAEIFSISPTLMFVKAGYVLAAIGALLLVAATSAFTQVSTVWAVVIGLLLFLIPAYYHVRQKLISYKLTESKIEIDTGFISRTTRNIPIRRIQDVTVSSTVLQRLLGFGNVVIDNASEEGGKIVLQNINTPGHYADVLLRQIRRLER
jgi:membrane protein YdbS with pleckstrin-like domain